MSETEGISEIVSRLESTGRAGAGGSRGLLRGVRIDTISSWRGGGLRTRVAVILPEGQGQLGANQPRETALQIQLLARVGDPTVPRAPRMVEAAAKKNIVQNCGSGGSDPGLALPSFALFVVKFR